MVMQPSPLPQQNRGLHPVKSHTQHDQSMLNRCACN